MDPDDEKLLSELLEKNRDAITDILTRLRTAVMLLHRNGKEKYIYIRAQLDNDGIEYLNATWKDAEVKCTILESAEPQIEKNADLFLECQIEHFLRLIQDGLPLEDAIISTKLDIRPTLKPLITPGQLARALQGKTTQDDLDLTEPVKCLRCGTAMYIVGVEHHVQDHGKDLLIELWSCNKCDYLEYRKGHKKGRKFI